MGEINMEQEILNKLQAHKKQNEILSTLFDKMKEEIDNLIVLLVEFYDSIPDEIKEELKDG